MVSWGKQWFEKTTKHDPKCIEFRLVFRTPTMHANAYDSALIREESSSTQHNAHLHRIKLVGRSFFFSSIFGNCLFISNTIKAFCDLTALTLKVLDHKAKNLILHVTRVYTAPLLSLLFFYLKK